MKRDSNIVLAERIGVALEVGLEVKRTGTEEFNPDRRHSYSYIRVPLKLIDLCPPSYNKVNPSIRVKEAKDMVRVLAGETGLFVG